MTERPDPALDPVPAPLSPAPPSPAAHDDLALPAEATEPLAPPRPTGGWREVLLRERSLAEARAELADVERLHSDDLRRARGTLLLAERTLWPADPLPTGPTPWVARRLAAESAFWTMRALSLPGDSLEAQLTQAPDSLLSFADEPGDERGPGRRDLLRGSSSPAAALGPLEVQEQEATAAIEVARSLLARATEPETNVARLLRSRLWRVATTVGVLVALVVGGVVGAQRLRQAPDLTRGKPWRTSSTYRGFNPAAHASDGNSTEVFFHTNEETPAWIEYDLQTPRVVHTVEVKNRTDCCSERAVPLVVETSNDRNQWTEVARRDEDFRTWVATVKPGPAVRYVRLRATRKTWLHLEKVSIR